MTMPLPTSSPTRATSSAAVRRRSTNIVVHLLNHEGVDHDVSNLICRSHTYSYIFTPCDYDSDSDCESVEAGDDQEQSVRRRSSHSSLNISNTSSMNNNSHKEELSRVLYPNLQDPCNRRLVQEVAEGDLNKTWDTVRPPTSTTRSSYDDDKDEEYCASFQPLPQTAPPQRAQSAAPQYCNNTHPCSPGATTCTASTASITTPGSASPWRSSRGSRQSPPSSAPNNGVPSWRSRRERRTTRASFTPRTNTSIPRVPMRNASFDQHRGVQPPSSSAHSASQSTRRATAPPQTPAPPGSALADIGSSNGGLRPRVNYKSLYNASTPTLQTSVSSSSFNNNFSDRESMTSSSHRRGSGSSMVGRWIEEEEEEQELQPHQEKEWPLTLEEDDDELETPVPTAMLERRETMEIAPNVRVPVLTREESWSAVRSGEYFVATCFVCTASLVCSRNAAFVLCPDCQVVSPTAKADTKTNKKDDVVGVATGLKPEWIQETLGTTVV